VLGELAKVGFDPVYGARPLKRAIQSEIENRWRRRSSRPLCAQGHHPRGLPRGRMLFEKAPARVAA